MGDTKRYHIKDFDTPYEARQVTEPRDFDAAMFAQGVVKVDGGQGYIEIEVPQKGDDEGGVGYNHAIVARIGDWIVRDLETGEVDVYPKGMFEDTFIQLDDEDKNPIEEQPVPTETPEYIIYPDDSVTPEGLIGVTPELFAELVPMLREQGLEEGDAYVFVRYVDFKVVIQQSGGRVKEVRRGVDL